MTATEIQSINQNTQRIDWKEQIHEYIFRNCPLQGELSIVESYLILSDFGQLYSVPLPRNEFSHDGLRVWPSGPCCYLQILLFTVDTIEKITYHQTFDSRYVFSGTSFHWSLFKSSIPIPI